MIKYYLIHEISKMEYETFLTSVKGNSVIDKDGVEQEYYQLPEGEIILATKEEEVRFETDIEIEYDECDIEYDEFDNEDNEDDFW